MKKILILQNEGNSLGGVWYVNKLIGEELLKHNYQVHIVSIRNKKTNIKLEYDSNLIVKIINEKSTWGTYQLQDIKIQLKKYKLLKALKMLMLKIYYHIFLKVDVIRLHSYINKYNPDYIVTSHYQLIEMIPKKMLNKVFHQQHSSFMSAIEHRATKKVLDKYKDKIKFLWLTKKTMENAICEGYINSIYIYNAVRFKSEQRSQVIKNKKLITIARLSKEKSLDIMIDIVENIFKDKKYKDWKLEIYGTGEEKRYLESKINNKKQIKLMGLAKEPKKELMSASINLNTSKYEGFSLSILEANECGVPTVAFNFGESTEEEILNEKTGIIAGSKEEYEEKLKELMDDQDKLNKMSENAKEFSKEFHIENIINKWIELFNEYDIGRIKK